ncbi:Na+/H+ antiporter [Chryseosolibacter indicus]|uniref:Na+/H+ antiporter n=1 Tax=Chryseosolibacter indicus TaxID=2782351 RepID=A0ABS5VPF0_9BACT|nr:Na+/H+ antiporter [Chryseosolibacter indicus]MBT1703303.1 Na+/H+ antiporter [Chryseosolibacter indicus]
MQEIATVIVLLAVVTALAQVTDLIKIPYPILLVIAGMGIGFIPGLPYINLHPEIVFLVFLPPILYEAAWSTSWPEFKAAKRPITLLAIGCVLFTTCAVAWIAHKFIPDLGWAEAFVLGAIISPPDAVAAAASTKGLSVPKRVITILEGESLVNDATGLIAYRYAVAAVVTGSFHLWEAGLKFFLVAGGGIFLGLALGRVFKWIHQITPDNPTTDTTSTFITPYIVYLVAESLHLSGVLAVVTCGLYLGWNSSTMFSQQTRLQAYSAWKTAIFILNGVVFILIGLQLPVVYQQIEDTSIYDLIKYGMIVSAAVIVGRLIWVYPFTYLPRILSKEIRTREPRPSLRLVTIIAWSGMRGVVSLAAALALPFVIEGSEPFPNRNLIIFLTFSVILATLVVQGLTLRPLIKLLGIKSDGKDHEQEQVVRLKIASSVIEHIEENYSLALSDEVLNQIKTKYEIRIQRMNKNVGQQRLNDEQINQFQNIQQELLKTERNMVLQLRSQGAISDEVLRKIEYELDLEETRLILEKA